MKDTWERFRESQLGILVCPVQSNRDTNPMCLVREDKCIYNKPEECPTYQTYRSLNG